MTDPQIPKNKNSTSFADEANADRVGIVTEFWEFLKENKKWWLLPILICFAGLIGLVIAASVGGGAAAPFIYTLH